MVLHWSLSDIKSPQVSRILVKILAILSNAVDWIVSTRPPISKSSTPFNNPLVIVPNAPITIGTIVTFMFHSFFNSLARSRYLSFFSLSFRFILWSAGTATSTLLLLLLLLLISLRVFFHWVTVWVTVNLKFSGLADLKNIEIRWSSVVLPSSSLLTYPFGIAPNARVATDVTITFIFHIFF